jgi:hypothetical protein
MQIRSYPKVYQVGHRAIENLFDGPVTVQEKVDGSQFSVQKTEDGIVHFRSKGAVVNPECPPSMFKPTVDHFLSVADKLVPGWVYRGEALAKPRHNTLAYDRVPKGNFALFDIDIGLECYTTLLHLSGWDGELGVDIVPTLWIGEVGSIEHLRDFLALPSFLGGQLVEGVVVKNYNQMNLDKQVCMGKLVREEFKEIHNHQWKRDNPGKNDFIEQIIGKYATPARYAKAAQHLREEGKLQGEMQDMPLLLREVQTDLKAECAGEIADELFTYFFNKKIGPGVSRGIASWYKDQLVEKAFV